MVWILAATIGCQVAKAKQYDWIRYANGQTKLQRNSMYVLAGWAGANLVTGAYLSQHTEGSARYFHRMNLYWNTINGVLAGAALLRLHKKTSDTESFSDVYKRQQTLEKTFLLNAGLDVAYVTAGVLLQEKSKNDFTRHDQWKGYGSSVVMQGGFLLAFDGIVYAVLHHKGHALDKALEKMQLSSTGSGVSVLFRF